jgi:hypothetical protein
MDPQPDAGILAEVHDAVRAGDAGALDALATLHGPDAVVAQCRAVKALILAAEFNHIPVLQWLADHGAATLDDCRADDCGAIIVAGEKGHLDTLQWLAARQAECGQPRTDFGDDCCGRFLYGITRPLTKGHVHILQWLVDRGALTVQRTRHHGVPALAVFGGLPAVLWMAQHYHNLGLTTRDFVSDCFLGDSPIANAAAIGDIAVLEWFEQQLYSMGVGKKAFSSICAADGVALLSAIEEGQIGAAEWLATRGAIDHAACKEVLAACDISKSADAVVHWLVSWGLSREDFAVAGHGEQWRCWWLRRLAVLALVGRRHAKFPQDQRYWLPAELLPIIEEQA